MKVLYVAEDGSEFDTELECRKYENKMPIMFNCFFERTNTIEEAIYIYFSPRSVSTFLDHLNVDYTEVAGIQYEDNSEELGYIWNNDSQEYVRYEMGEIADMGKFLRVLDEIFKERKC